VILSKWRLTNRYDSEGTYQSGRLLFFVIEVTGSIVEQGMGEDLPNMLGNT
jgi:hypothetical protein